MQPELLLVGVVVVTVLVAMAGFAVGERRRREDAGLAGPRPARSIGEGLRAALPRRARVLVFFLDDDEAGLEAAAAVAEDPAVVELLSRPDLVHVIIRSSAKEGREIGETLFEKYAGEALPAASVAVLLLDADGQRIGIGREEKPIAEWLVDWVKNQPLYGVSPLGEQAPPTDEG